MANATDESAIRSGCRIPAISFQLSADSYQLTTETAGSVHIDRIFPDRRRFLASAGAPIHQAFEIESGSIRAMWNEALSAVLP